MCASCPTAWHCRSASSAAQWHHLPAAHRQPGSCSRSRCACRLRRPSRRCMSGLQHPWQLLEVRQPLHLTPFSPLPSTTQQSNPLLCLAQAPSQPQPRRQRLPASQRLQASQSQRPSASQRLLPCPSPLVLALNPKLHLSSRAPPQSSPHLPSPGLPTRPLRHHHGPLPTHHAPMHHPSRRRQLRRALAQAVPWLLMLLLPHPLQRQPPPLHLQSRQP